MGRYCVDVSAEQFCRDTSSLCQDDVNPSQAVLRAAFGSHCWEVRGTCCYLRITAHSALTRKNKGNPKKKKTASPTILLSCLSVCTSGMEIML